MIGKKRVIELIKLLQSKGYDIGVEMQSIPGPSIKFTNFSGSRDLENTKYTPSEANIYLQGLLEGMSLKKR